MGVRIGYGEAKGGGQQNIRQAHEQQQYQHPESSS